jgi:carboxylesterase
MGGAIALHLAATEDPAAVIAMATPLRLRPLLSRLARAVRPVMPYVPVLVRVGPRSSDVLRYRVSYPRIPLGVTGDLSLLLDRTRELLPRVRAPLLVAQGRRDWAVPPKSAEVICAQVSSQVRRLVWLPNSRHVVTLDRDREVLFAEVRRFLSEYVPAT